MTARRLFAALFAISLFAMAVRETLDPDMWWHLRTGQLILEDGIPRQDVFSYTVPDHRWVTHEWLSQLFMWLVYLPGGLGGLILVFAAIIALSFWLVYLTCNGRPYMAAFIALLAAIASAPFWGVRPQMFNVLFTALFVFLVEGFKDGRVSRRSLWLLPVIVALWANLHSGYLLGVVLLITYVAGESAQRLLRTNARRGLDWVGIRWLLLMAVLGFLAGALNPNGPELWIYPFFTLGSGAMQSYIQEWQSPNFHLKIFWPFAAMLALGLVSWVASRRRPDLTDLLLFGGTGAAALLSARNIPIFAVVSAPILARYLLFGLEGTRLYPLFSGNLVVEQRGRLTALNWLLLLVALVVAGAWVTVKIQGNEQSIASHYPVTAVDFLENQGLVGRPGYNSYNWGGYLIWRGIPVYVDGRADVYGDEFLHFYRRTFEQSPGWQEPLDAFDVEYVIVERASPLGTLLTATNEWREAYLDGVAAVFVRNGAEARSETP